MNLEIRPITFENYDRIIDIWQKAGLHLRFAGRDSKEDMTRQITLDPELWLGAFADGQLAGLVVGTYDGRKGYINRLAVLPEMQRQGIATALVKELERIFDSRGICVITLLIEDQSAESHEFFRKLGYHCHDDIKYYSKRVSWDV